MVDRAHNSSANGLNFVNSGNKPFVSVKTGGIACRKKRRDAFTRVELLIVIACLIALGCLGVAWRGRIQDLPARKSCQLNHKKLWTGLNEYALEHREFPAASGRGNPRVDDWVHWQSNRLLEESALARHMTPFDGRVLRCPEDRAYPYREYAYSYSMNAHLDKMERAGVLNPENLCLVYEEEAPNDGACVPGAPEDRLSQRHRGRSNTVFLDGRIEMITEKTGRATKHARPTLREEK
jgi:prepilin-type processing-associated H-X9-DG protein